MQTVFGQSNGIEFERILVLEARCGPDALQGRNDHIGVRTGDDTVEIPLEHDGIFHRRCHLSVEVEFSRQDVR